MKKIEFQEQNKDYGILYVVVLENWIRICFHLTDSFQSSSKNLYDKNIEDFLISQLDSIGKVNEDTHFIFAVSTEWINNLISMISKKYKNDNNVNFGIYVFDDCSSRLVKMK